MPTIQLTGASERGAWFAAGSYAAPRRAEVAVKVDAVDALAEHAEVVPSVLTINRYFAAGGAIFTRWIAVSTGHPEGWEQRCAFLAAHTRPIQ
jgi:hypothetical protein